MLEQRWALSRTPTALAPHLSRQHSAVRTAIASLPSEWYPERATMVGNLSIRDGEPASAAATYCIAAAPLS